MVVEKRNGRKSSAAYYGVPANNPTVVAFGARLSSLRSGFPATTSLGSDPFALHGTRPHGAQVRYLCK